MGWLHRVVYENKLLATMQQACGSAVCRVLVDALDAMPWLIRDGQFCCLMSAVDGGCWEWLATFRCCVRGVLQLPCGWVDFLCSADAWLGMILMQKGAGLECCFCMKWLMPLLMWEPYAGERWGAAVRLAWSDAELLPSGKSAVTMMQIALVFWSLGVKEMFLGYGGWSRTAGYLQAMSGGGPVCWASSTGAARLFVHSDVISVECSGDAATWTLSLVRFLLW
ncbi:hypothetical protein Nepgr_006767 [Nepenthes gracilis]|uniref:Uncharacterized protein n=1 Tax=Nepenthes gracilis TaxID=150966 RepID=A0AAD3S5M4_NEPGR|nr:hypothetical protein Nepgr_006767 [Nepenthes gracilis]